MTAYLTPAKVHSPKTTDKKTIGKWFELMTLGRLIDNRAPNYLKQALGWSYHAPCAGHDGIQLALGQVFQKGKDHLFPYYRDMLTAISAGLSIEEIILNGLSKADDLASGGRHMSNHFAKPEWNIHNVSSCTGNHASQAVGVARAMKYYKHSGVAFSSQGESSVSEGYCYEAINGASREKVPTVFVIQDNDYGISVPKWVQTANEYCSDNFSGFKNLKIIHCDGKDVFDSMNAMIAAREHAIKHSEPVMVHAKCVRMGSHSNSDKHELYRDEKEINAAKAKDPLAKFRKQLLDEKLFSEKELVAIEEKCKGIVLDAHTKVVKMPDPTPESIHNFLYPPAHEPTQFAQGLPEESSAKTQEMSLITAINETLKSEFRKNPDTFIWGQDVANKEKGGIFNVTKGMQQEFTDGRVFNAPIAEDYIVATANGFSRFKPEARLVIEGAEFADYFWPAMEQLVDTSHDYWRSNGAFSPNMVIRLASGGYIGGGLYHSQNIEGTLSTLPGVRIVVPAFADDAAGLLRTAMKSQGITMYLEPKALYNAKNAYAQVPEDFEVPFGKARVRNEGKDLTIITYGNTVQFCLQLAKELEDDYSIEVIDLRSLIPLDEAAILESVKKTGRALVVHEDKIFGGFGGELTSLIMEKGFEFLDAPVSRVGAEYVPVGFNRILERATLPNMEKIKQAALKVLKY